MRKGLSNFFVALPTVALVVGLLVWFDLIPPDVVGCRIFVWIWSAATLAIWSATVVMASAWVKGPRWLVRPLGLLAVAGTITVGVGGFFRGSVALFGGLLGLTLAASALLLHEASRGGAGCRSFCRGFVVGIWGGVALTLLARGPVTGTPILRIMWWDASQWSNGLGWNGAAYQGINYLLLTWLFAFYVGWLAGSCEGSGALKR